MSSAPAFDRPLSFQVTFSEKPLLLKIEGKPEAKTLFYFWWKEHYVDLHEDKGTLDDLYLHEARYLLSIKGNGPMFFAENPLSRKAFIHATKRFEEAAPGYSLIQCTGLRSFAEGKPQPTHVPTHVEFEVVRKTESDTKEGETVACDPSAETPKHTKPQQEVGVGEKIQRALASLRARMDARPLHPIEAAKILLMAIEEEKDEATRAADCRTGGIDFSTAPVDKILQWHFDALAESAKRIKAGIDAFGEIRRAYELAVEVDPNGSDPVCRATVKAFSESCRKFHELTESLKKSQ